MGTLPRHSQDERDRVHRAGTYRRCGKARDRHVHDKRGDEHGAAHPASQGSAGEHGGEQHGDDGEMRSRDGHEVGKPRCLERLLELRICIYRLIAE